MRMMSKKLMVAVALTGSMAGAGVAGAGLARQAAGTAATAPARGGTPSAARSSVALVTAAAATSTVAARLLTVAAAVAPTTRPAAGNCKKPAYGSPVTTDCDEAATAAMNQMALEMEALAATGGATPGPVL
jgi:hypothetical protein